MLYCFLKKGQKDMKVNLIDKIKSNKIYPIIRKTNPAEVKSAALALMDAGIDVMEITVENPKVFNVIEELSGDIIICAGGIITSMQAKTAIDCGARIISSPIFQTNLVKISKDRQLPLIAGTSTANEAYNAWKARIPIVKIYPAAALGGADYIENMLRPMPFLNVIPQGDIKLNQAADYLKAGALAVGIGRHLTAFDKPSEITDNAKKLLESLNG